MQTPKSTVRRWVWLTLLASPGIVALILLINLALHPPSDTFPQPATPSDNGRAPDSSAPSTTNHQWLTSAPDLGRSPGSQHNIPAENWLDAFPEHQRAKTKSDAIVRMLEKEVVRLFPADEERILVHPDGATSSEAADIDVERLTALDPIFIETRGNPKADFDHVVVAFRDRQTSDIALVVTCLMRDGTVVPAQYSTYPVGRRPPQYPFATPDEAREKVRASAGAPRGEPKRIFFQSPVSPAPMLFVYEFMVDNSPIYVSQDGAVWFSLNEMFGPFER